jgi:hypothetical protein
VMEEAITVELGGEAMVRLCGSLWLAQCGERRGRVVGPGWMAGLEMTCYTTTGGCTGAWAGVTAAGVMRHMLRERERTGGKRGGG